MVRKLRHEVQCSWCFLPATYRRRKYDHYTECAKFSCEIHKTDLEQYEKTCGFDENDNGYRTEADYQTWMKA